MQRHKSHCSRENATLSSGTLLASKNFNPYPPPLWINIHDIQVLEMAKIDKAKCRKKNHSRLTITILPCTAYTVITALPRT